jgi:polysaccharide biosynthesis transport protein
MEDNSVSSTSPPYAALVPASPMEAAPVAADSGWPVGLPGDAPAAVAGGVEFTPAKVLRALRRRWYAALCLAVVGGGLAGYLADRVVSSTYTARTQVFIPTDRGVPFAGQDGPGDVASHQRRQSALVRNRHVLQAALQQPGVADLTILNGNADPVGWLEKELQVDFNSSPELMRITLKGSPPEDLLPVLNAVRDAYLQAALKRDVTDKTGTLRWLRQLIADEQTKLETARAEVRTKAGEMNAPDAAAVRLRYQGESAIVANLNAMRFGFDVQAADLQKARDNLVASAPNAATPVQVSPAEIKSTTESAVAKDAESETLRTTERRLRAEIADYKRRIKPGAGTQSLDDKEAELKDVQTALATREEALKAQTIQRLEEEARLRAESRTHEYRSRLADLAEQIDRLRLQIRSVNDEIQKHDTITQRDLSGIAELDRLTTRVSDVEAKIKMAQTRAEVIETELGFASPHQAQTHEEAVIVQVPNPAKKNWMVMGAVAVGLVGGLFGVAFLDLRTGRIDSPEGVDRRLHTGVVGCIPRAPASALAQLAQPIAPPVRGYEASLFDAADACRTLLLNALSGQGSKVIMVTSAVPGEGKTSLATQLALSLGRGGHRTLLIDADTRHPGVHSTFDRTVTPGLTDVLRKTYAVQDVVRKSHLPNLGIIPAGQCNPQEAVALFQLRMGSLLRKCKPHFEVIVIDTPPLLGLPDAMVIGRHADGTILSLMNEVSTLPAAQAACARLRTLNIPLLGAVLNAARVRMPVGY